MRWPSSWGSTTGSSWSAPPVQDPQSAIALCAEYLPDVVLMDVDLKSGMSGIDATRAIKEISPATKVVIMTAHDDDRLLVEAVEAGASGFLGKDDAAEEVLAAVEGRRRRRGPHRPGHARPPAPAGGPRARARSATRSRCSTISRTASARSCSCSPRACATTTSRRKLYISPQTVQTHVRNILGKLRVHSKLEAVAFAVRSRRHHRLAIRRSHPAPFFPTPFGHPVARRAHRESRRMETRRRPSPPGMPGTGCVFTHPRALRCCRSSERRRSSDMPCTAFKTARSATEIIPGPKRATADGRGKQRGGLAWTGSTA